MHRFFCYECFRIIFYIIYLFLFLYSNTILAGKDQESSTSKNQENSTSKNNKILYEYYKNLFSDERIKEDFLQLIVFFNESNISLNKRICKLILRCDTHYCTKFMFNIKFFFTHEKFKNITIQQFAEWFDGDPQQVRKFSTLTKKLIKKIAMHPLLSSYLSSLYKGFGFPNISEINIILIKMNRSNIQEHEKIIQKLIALNITDTPKNNQLPNDSFNPIIDELKKSSHLLLYMHNRHIIVTDRFLLWMGRIPHYLFKRTCKKMIIFLKKLANPCECDVIIDMITRKHLESFVLCDDNEIEHIASLKKINDIMMMQQGQGFPSYEATKRILETERIETIWPQLCIQFKGHGFPTQPAIFIFLKKIDQYNEKIEMYIHFIKSNNPHIQWSCIESNALRSMLYFLLSNDVKDILLLSHIFYNVSQNCSAVIYKIMTFIHFLDDHLINIRKLSGLLYSSDAIKIFIELPNNTLQLLAKYEQSHDIINFFQKENSVLLKKLTDILNKIYRHYCLTSTYDNPELNKQFEKLKIYWLISFIAINLDKEKIIARWHLTMEPDFLPIFEALLKNNIIIDHCLYEILFNKRKKKKKFM